MGTSATSKMQHMYANSERTKLRIEIVTSMQLTWKNKSYDQRQRFGGNESS